MNTDKTYNGWTNYETWAVKLWIDNEESSQTHWLAQARLSRVSASKTKHPVWTPQEHTRFALADKLKEDFETQSRGMLTRARQSCSVWADLINAALSEVNWQEIADNLLSDFEPLPEPTAA